MTTPTAKHFARAQALVAAKTDAEVVALVGNWRPLTTTAAA